KTLKFTAKLINTNGKALKGKIIKFKFKGKTYNAKTNKNGIATLSLKNLKVGKYVIKTTYGKSSVKNTVKVRK
ncbi:MAG: adhesin, partial [Methanobrevibacter sp.]|nr:adhesin [Methanobrevibacter sp.]